MFIAVCFPKLIVSLALHEVLLLHVTISFKTITHSMNSYRTPKGKEGRRGHQIVSFRKL